MRSGLFHAYSYMEGQSLVIDSNVNTPAEHGLDLSNIKKQLYEKSVTQTLECFNLFLEENDFHNANMCLQTWKVHSQEIGVFDQVKYEALKERLSAARALP